jgi:hypothetical protein
LRDCSKRGLEAGAFLAEYFGKINILGAIGTNVWVGVLMNLLGLHRPYFDWKAFPIVINKWNDQN